MIDGDILRTLQEAVTAAVAASTQPLLPVAYIDLPFTVPSDQKYLEIVFIPNNPPGTYWGDERDYMGMLRLVLHWPKTGAGPYVPLALLASVSAYFTKGRYLGPVKVMDGPTFTGRLDQGSEILYPSSLRYQRFQ